MNIAVRERNMVDAFQRTGAAPSARRRRTAIEVSGGGTVIQREFSSVLVGVDDDRAQSHVTVLERGLAKIHRDDLVLVGSGAGELGFVGVHLVGHGRAWSDGEGESGKG